MWRMQMLSFLTPLAKAAFAIVTVPAAAVADFITLGGALTEEPQPYTATELEKLHKNIKQLTK